MVSQAQIHRATSPYNYQIRYNSNFTFQYFLKKIGAYENKEYSDNQPIFNFYSKQLIVWVTSIIGTFFVGICGILPVVVLPSMADDHQKLVESNRFKCCLSFAAGTLLGDVFLHLLPETYTKSVLDDNGKVISNGLWVLFGLISFLSIEKIFPDHEQDADNKKSGANFLFFNSIRILGILNLFANVIDNFTHGIAVAGSFQASIKFGFITLIATLLHEIPHEIGDFVILLKSGLNYKEAALAQLGTAFSGISGAIFALASSSAQRAGEVTSWVLPFASGGFLYISLVNIVPEIVNERHLSNSLKQVSCLILGIFLVHSLSIVFD
ncbi:zinc transporter ZIP13 isoform X2 [Brachionus plicatilis]|uniref:Zinc transporter ZIP13 isoform X2 n=1 Tax=Brachionus plicatilis TaxID=10195 RepID=A0A3M7R6D8_BRAPC|nr:zinc transporter ZIP13 isoform X2 [Brachionus plicatilis]